jgi:membrane-associated phospholipid phosphatase
LDLRKTQIYFACFFALDILLFPVKPYAQNIDVDILKGINPRYPTSQYWIQTSSSAYWVPGTFTVGSLAYGFIANDYKEKMRGCQSLISVGTAIVFTEILKPIVHRTRPGDAYPNEIFPNSPTHGSSFPSGHTTLAFATATTIALEYKKWYITVPAYLWAGSVGYSRMYLGKHYPTDVLAGAAIGIGGAYLGHWLTKKIFRNNYQLKMQ